MVLNEQSFVILTLKNVKKQTIQAILKDLRNRKGFSI